MPRDRARGLAKRECGAAGPYTYSSRSKCGAILLICMMSVDHSTGEDIDYITQVVFANCVAPE